jgi:hypothetical protein
MTILEMLHAGNISDIMRSFGYCALRDIEMYQSKSENLIQKPTPEC